MSGSIEIEVERKYDVDGSASVPDLVGADRVAAVAAEGVRRLATVYLDTEGMALGRRGIVLRRRTGGPDAGWHVKSAGDGRGREERRMPLGDGGLDAPPEELVGPLRQHLDGAPLAPIATLEVERHVLHLLGADGAVLAELADDRVLARPLRGAESSWREWEVELVAEVDEAAGDALLDAVEARLLAAGAAVASSSAKIARALGG